METATVCCKIHRNDNEELYFKKARDETKHKLFDFLFLLKNLLLKYKHHGIVMEQDDRLKINSKKVLEKRVFAVYFHEQSRSLLLENNAMKVSITEQVGWPRAILR